MKINSQQIVAWFDGRTKRERIFMSGVAAIVLLLLWGLLLFRPLSYRLDRISAEKSVLAKRIKTLNDQYVVLTQSGNLNQNNKAHKAKLQRDLSQLNQQLSIFESDLIATKKMASVVHTIVAEQQDLSLVSLQSQPPKRLEATLNLLSDKHLVKHTMVLALSGQFFSIYHFLEAIEQAPWRIFWDKLDYQVDHYPVATVQITIHILSRH